MVAKATKPAVLDVKSVKQYYGQMGTYSVIANKGDSEAAMSIAVASEQMKDAKGEGFPALGLAFRIRFYDREDVGSNPFTGFKNTESYGSHDGASVYRIKKFIPISHGGVGLTGMLQVWTSKGGTAELTKQIKAAVKASKGKMVVSDAMLAALIEQTMEVIPLKVPSILKIDVNGDGSGNGIGNTPLPSVSKNSSQFD